MSGGSYGVHGTSHVFMAWDEGTSQSQDLSTCWLATNYHGVGCDGRPQGTNLEDKGYLGRTANDGISSTANNLIDEKRSCFTTTIELIFIEDKIRFTL
jgi:hypothetical protein